MTSECDDDVPSNPLYGAMATLQEDFRNLQADMAKLVKSFRKATELASQVEFPMLYVVMCTRIDVKLVDSKKYNPPSEIGTDSTLCLVKVGVSNTDFYAQWANLNNEDKDHWVSAVKYLQAVKESFDTSAMYKTRMYQLSNSLRSDDVAENKMRICHMIQVPTLRSGVEPQGTFGFA